MPYPDPTYESVKRTWLMSQNFASQEDLDRAADAFDQFLADFLQANMPAQSDADEPSRGQFLMEMILEIDEVAPMVPPRLKTYRELLAAQGLDRTVKSSEDDEGQRGVPGINLADQASLEFHSHLLGLAFSIAQASVVERMEAKKSSNLDEKPGSHA